MAGIVHDRNVRIARRFGELPDHSSQFGYAEIASAMRHQIDNTKEIAIYDPEKAPETPLG